MFCKNCGNEMRDGAKFCPKCGCGVIESNIVTESGASDSENKKNNGKKRAAVAAASVSILLIIAVAVFLVHTNKKNPFSANVKESATTFEPADTETTNVPENVESTEQENDSEAMDQLLAILDDSDTAYNKYISDLKDSEDSGYNSIIDINTGFLTDIDDLYKQAKAVEGLSSNISKAVDDYYGLYISGVVDLNKNMKFRIDFDDLYAVFDSDDLVKAYTDFEEKYSSIECPDNIKEQWNNIGKVVESSYAEYLIRSEEGNKLGDYLRLYSARNHAIRFYTVLANERERLMKIISGELGFANKQCDEAPSISKEIRKAAELSPDEIEYYEFTYNIENVLSEPYYDHIEMIYPSLYNSYGSFVTVNLGCYQGERDIIVECEIPGLSQKTSQSYHIGSEITVFGIKPPASDEKIDFDKAKDSQIRISIKDKNDGSVIDEQSFPVHIASRNDFVWYDDEFGLVTQDNILCFLTDSDAIAGLKRKAIDSLSAMTGGSMNALVGYQGPYYKNDLNQDGKYDNQEITYAQFATTFLQAAALMRAMSEMGVVYTNDSFSIDNSGQHILFPDQVLERKTGLCIETSLVIASALQSMGMHTFLVFPPGHAQVAVETWEGSGQYFLIETTAVPNEASQFIDEANFFISGGKEKCDNNPIRYYTQEQWGDYLDGNDPQNADDDCYVIDCSDGAMLGLTPFAF